ncbi:MAG: MarC family protein [Holosporales bacterium]|jgi:multiple antibiotic resistance protein|nr:MarC family protein [Holosporales bacterium]
MVSYLDIGKRAFISFLTISNPLLIVSLFISLTRKYSSAQRKSTALKGVLIAFCLLVVISWGGEPLLSLIGISFPSFKIAGGLLLFLSGINMVTAKEEEDDESMSAADVTVFPLAMPFIAGPGAMTIGISFMEESHGDFSKICAIIVAIASVFFLNWVCMHHAERLMRLLGRKTLDIVVRLLGMIVTTIAVELVISGVRATFFTGS